MGAGYSAVRELPVTTAFQYSRIEIVPAVFRLPEPIRGVAPSMNEGFRLAAVDEVPCAFQDTAAQGLEVSRGVQ